MRQRTRRDGHLTVISLLLIFAVAGGVGVAISLHARSVILLGAARVAEVEMGALATTSLDLDRVRQASPPDFTRFDEALEERYAEGGLRAVRLYRLDGDLLLDSAATGVMTPETDEERLGEARRGELALSVASVHGAEGDARVLMVYAPLRLPGDGELVGVAEAVTPYEDVAADLRRTYGVVWPALMAGAALAWLGVLLLQARASRQVEETEMEVARVNGRLQESMFELEEHSLGTLRALTSAVDARDSYTARHSLSVADIAGVVARRLGAADDEILALERACLLHDIGKIGVPEGVLLKPSALSRDERLAIEDHSVIGAQIVSSIPFLRSLVPVIRHHHERWDGDGYPDGLVGGDIPRLSRVIAVADAFDSMTSERPYRRPLTPETARAEIVRNRGTQFEPDAVDALLAALDAGEIHVSGVRSGRSRAPGTAEAAPSA